MRLTVNQHRVLFGTQRAASMPSVLSYEAAALHKITFATLHAVGLTVQQLLDGGFTLENLLTLKMCGADFVTRLATRRVVRRVVPPMSRFAGLQNTWPHLSTWTLDDLVTTGATMAELLFLGVTAATLRARGLNFTLVTGLPAITPAEWAVFGLNIADILCMRLEPHHLRDNQWSFLAVKAAFRPSNSEMHSIGFTLCHTLL
jgi:hypothetical protein